MALVLLIVLVILNVLDIVTTRIAISQGAREANPFLVWCVSKIGWTLGPCLPKLVWIGFFTFLTRYYRSSTLLIVVLLLACFFYAVIVWRNFNLMEVS